MEFKKAILDQYIEFIKTEDDLDAFIDSAGVDQRYRAATCEEYHERKSLTITNSRTGEYCLAYEYVPRLMEQAI